MSDLAGAESEPKGAAPVPASALDDPGLPLADLDARLAPLRRVVAWAVSNPADSAGGGVRWFEANANRWLTPLLALDLPDPLRDLLVAAAGQVHGYDAAEPAMKVSRMERLRQLLTRLDAVLGLPLPRADRAFRRKGPRPAPAGDAPSTPDARPEPSEGHREGRGSGKKGRNKQREPEVPRPAPAPAAPEVDEDDLDLDAVLEIDDDEEDGDDDEPQSDDRPRGRWTGNPNVPLAALDLDEGLRDALAASGRLTVGDLLLTAPVDEELIKPIHGAGRELPQGRVAVGGRVAYRWSVCTPEGRIRREATLTGAGPARLSWAPGSPSAWWLDVTLDGERAVVVGTWDGAVLRDPELVFDDGKVVRRPRYGLPGVDDTRLQALLFRLLPGVRGLRDPVPASARGAQLALPDALLALHGRGDREAGRRRLAFDEVLTLTLGTGWTRLGAQKVRGIAHAILHAKADRVLQGMGGPLDDSQELAFDDIRRDLRRSRPMRRVLTGPPGGRKSLLGLLAAVMIAEGKGQVLWVCSDAQMADVRFTHMEPILREIGVSARLGSDTPNAGLRDAVRRGDVHVLFGTDALLRLAEPLEFRRLGLVVSSERARLGGVSQAVEQMKAPRPDLLVIPASAPSAEVLLGAWSTHDISAIAGAKPPEVAIHRASDRDAPYALARSAITDGGQVAVLFPQIGGADALDPTEARQVVQALGERSLVGARIGLLHGSLQRDERVRVLGDLSHRRLDAVVSTGPLEDGPPVPGLQVAVVEHAHRMDALRLSRLAGLGVSRVLLIVADDTPDVRIEELRAVVRGERPAPAPAEPGPALPRFRFVDLQGDGALILQARAAALEILSVDAGLRSGQHAELLRSAHARWSSLVDEPCPLPDPGEANPAKRRRKRRRRR